MRTRRIFGWGAMLAGLAAGLTACGSDDKAGPYGNYDFDLAVSASVTCMENHWTGTLRDNGFTPADSVTVLSWKVGVGEPEAKDELTIDGTNPSVTLDAAAVGVACDSADTMLIFMPRAGGTFGDVEDAGSRGAVQGGGYNGLSGTFEWGIQTDSTVAVKSVEVHLYNLGTGKAGATFDLAEGATGTWTGTSSGLADGVMAGIVAKDAGGKVVGVMAL